MFKNPYTQIFFAIIWNFDFPQEKYGLNIAACCLVLHLYLHMLGKKFV